MGEQEDEATTTEHGWEHFTPHLPEVIEDPYPAFRWLRHHAPVFYVASEDIWVLSRHADIQAAARDFQTFSQLEGVGYAREHGGLGLTSLDPPHHTEMRRLTAPLFSPRAVKQHRAQAVGDVLLLDEVFAASEPVNLAEVVANPYLSTIVGDLMGLPEHSRALVKDGATAGSLMMAGDFDPVNLSMAEQFVAYFEGTGDLRDAVGHRRQRDHRATALQPHDPALRAAGDPRAAAHRAAAATVGRRGSSPLHIPGDRAVPPHHPRSADPRS